MSESSSGLDIELSPAELETTREHVVAFIRDQIAAAGADGAVMGLSGGIDSTLTSHLVVEAIGADSLHGLVLPASVSRDDNMSDAEAVAQDLGIDYDVVPVDPIVEAVLEAAPGTDTDGIGSDDAAHQVPVGNVRARTRTVLNYLVANRDDALVIGTGNRTEAQVGYFTKYGDGAVDCHPIGDLYKQQVRQLARHVGVPNRIIEKPPTAGLWAGQTDEAELGLAYETLDAILALAVDGPLSAAATARHLDGVIEDDVEHVLELHRTSAHKRRMPPSPGPAL
ncbi:MAG: NAD+ synthase [Halobacteriales archaeon]